MKPPLRLRHPDGETPIFIGQGAFDAAAAPLADWLADRSVFVITDPAVLALQGDILRPLAAVARAWHVLEVEQGEAAKTLDTAGELWAEMLRAGGKRDSRVLAFGGGSIGDLAGFVSACFLRGVAVAQLPTTVLAQADAAIGGKTAIDLPEAKNSVGAFHHPDFVVADSRWLSTLPADQLRSGLAETIKMAALFDLELLAAIEDRLESLMDGDAGALGEVVEGAARWKIAVVEGDPEERGERALLNFGHTLGHALETAAGYRGLLHGDAVAWGMLFAVRLSLRRGMPEGDAARLRELLRRLGPAPLPAVAAGDLADLMRRDKKARESGLEWILLERLGSGKLDRGIARRETELSLEAFLADPWSLWGTATSI